MAKKSADLRIYKTELMISNVLRYGVLLCAVVISIGLIWKLGVSDVSVEKDILSLLLAGKWIPADPASEILSSANF